MSEDPLIYCLCPTYGRPALLPNSIACFEAQAYPSVRRRLLIGDDGLQLPPQISGNIEVISHFHRFPSITAKFNHLAEYALNRGAEILVVWEDDDVYLPHHLAVHARSLEEGLFSKPSKVLSTYGNQLHEEGGAGRFHASMAFTREGYLAVGGWPDTLRADFDQELISRLDNLRKTVDPCVFAAPSYVFRWASTGHGHGQSQMRSPDDETWWDRCAQKNLPPLPGWKISSRFDAETINIYESVSQSYLKNH